MPQLKVQHATAKTWCSHINIKKNTNNKIGWKKKEEERKIIWRIFLIIQWLRIPTSAAVGLSSNPGQGTKVLQKAARKQVKNQNQSPVPQTTMTEKTPRETILKKIKKERSFGKIDDCRKPRQF